MKLPHITTNPEYAAAVAKQGEISSALARATARVAEIEALQQHQTQPNVDALTAADALLQGEGLAGGLREELQELRAQADLLRRAQESQQQVVSTAASQASSALRATLQTQHSAIAKKALDALIALEQALQEEAQLFDVIVAGGYRVVFPETVASPTVGRMNEPSDFLWRRSFELSQYLGFREHPSRR